MVAVSDRQEPSIIADAWRVNDGDQGQLVDALVDLFDQLRRLDGFLDGEILRGEDPTRVLTYVRMGSPAQRDAAFVDPKIRNSMRRIKRIARASPATYTVFRRFTGDEPSA